MNRPDIPEVLLLTPATIVTLHLYVCRTTCIGVDRQFHGLSSHASLVKP